MKTTLLGAALAFALFFAPQAALAQQCWNFDDTLAQLAASDEVTSGQMILMEIDAKDLEAFVTTVNEATGVTYEGVTRAFVFIGPKVLVGLEIAGCLLDPIELVTPMNSSMSGKLPDGRTAA
jgi:hypothetical protein